MFMKGIYFLISCFIITQLSACKPLAESDNLSKEDIFFLVVSNEKLLRETVEEIKTYPSKISYISTMEKTDGTEWRWTYIEDDSEEPDSPISDTFIEVLDIQGLQSISVSDEYIRFYCGGEGFGPNTSYYGFYYIDGDTKIDSLFPIELVPEGEGFSWVNDSGGDKFYIEKIMQNFYYYEDHY